MKRDKYEAALLLVFSAVVYFILIPNQIRFHGLLFARSLNPSFMPRIITIILLCLSILLFLVPSLEKESSTEEKGLKPQQGKKPWLFPLVIGIIIAYIFSLKALGHLIASPLALVVLMTIMGGLRRWKMIIAVAVLVPASIYLLFVSLLSIPIPMGIF